MYIHRTCCCEPCTRFFFVTAPNLNGHCILSGTDLRVHPTTTLADVSTSYYDTIIIAVVTIVGIIAGNVVVFCCIQTNIGTKLRYRASPPTICFSIDTQVLGFTQIQKGPWQKCRADRTRFFEFMNV